MLASASAWEIDAILGYSNCSFHHFKLAYPAFSGLRKHVSQGGIEMTSLELPQPAPKNLNAYWATIGVDTTWCELDMLWDRYMPF